MGVQLDARYQIEAYEAIKNSINKTGKAGIVLPTGTGKTYLALKLIEDNLDKKQILYVSHSPTLNVQIRKTIREGIDVTQIKQVIRKNGKQRRTYLSEIQNENIEQIIKKLGLNRKYPIGMKISNLKQAYNGTLYYKITDEDRRRTEALGLVSELDKKVAEQNRLKEKAKKTKDLKRKVEEQLEKQDGNKKLGEKDE